MSEFEPWPDDDATRFLEHERATRAELWPACRGHHEVQHRDGKPPWCESCGWNRGRPAVPPRLVVER